jgi:hypothetical protein
VTSEARSRFVQQLPRDPQHSPRLLRGLGWLRVLSVFGRSAGPHPPPQADRSIIKEPQWPPPSAPELYLNRCGMLRAPHSLTVRRIRRPSWCASVIEQAGQGFARNRRIKTESK